jgi:Domain of unknown function (DUF6457)
MDANEWIDKFAVELGTDPPSEDESGEILELAATAAHASERIAAPLACWLAGRDGRSLAELREIADGIEPT